MKTPLFPLKSSLLSVAIVATWSAGALDISTITPTTTDRLAELLTSERNEETGDCSGLTFSQVADTVALSGDNRWSAANVTFDLGAVSKVFDIPNLHFLPGGSVLLKQGTLKTKSLFAGEIAGEIPSRLTIQGANARLQLADGASWGSKASSTEFYLLDGASMLGDYSFVLGYSGQQSRYALVDGSGTTMGIKSLSIGANSVRSVMDIRDATITVTNLYVGSGNFFPGMSGYVPDIGNRLTVSNAAVTVRSAVIVGEKAASHNRLEIADGSKMSASYLYVGYRGDNVNASGFNNTVLVTGSGTEVNLKRPDGSATSPALFVGNLYNATNSLMISDGAVVTVDGSIAIGYNPSSCANTVRVDNATLTVVPSSGSHKVNVGYQGADNALIVDNGGMFVANGSTVAPVVVGAKADGKRNLLAVRNRSTADIGTLSFGANNNARVEVDNATLAVGTLGNTSYKPLITLKGASPRLEVKSVSYYAMTNRFVLGATTKTATQRDDFIYHLGTVKTSNGAEPVFEVRVENGCPNGTYKLLDWESWSGHDDSKVKDLFSIDCPDNYKVTLHTKYTDEGVHGNYVAVSVRQKMGLVLMVR